MSSPPDLERLAALLPADGPVMWCDSARTHPVTGRWSVLGWDPWLTLTAHGERLTLRTAAATRQWRAHPLDALRQVLRRYAVPARSIPQARAIGLFGFLSYDLSRWIERLPPPPAGGLGLPTMAWYGMRLIVLVDHAAARGWLLSLADPHSPPALARRVAREALDRTLELIAASGAAAPSRVGTSSPPRAERGALGSVAGDQWVPVPTMSQRDYERLVERVLQHVRAGDIYQANLAQRFTARWAGDPLALYRRLRRVNPSPFACYLAADGMAVVSCSPERLVRVQEGIVETRPIAGTRPRGATAQEDALQTLELLLSEKERAEHIMLVDLARNDLGRVSGAGSVAVDELMAIEEYSHVLHIVSNVSGRLARGRDAVDVIRAVFPGGTITGCPKVRCLQILRELEPVPRELYTGSLGLLAFDGTMDLNIAIRTIVCRGPQLSFHVGAGIVADSRPDREYEETLAKGRALVAALQSTAAEGEAVHAAAR